MDANADRALSKREFCKGHGNWRPPEANVEVAVASGDGYALRRAPQTSHWRRVAEAVAALLCR